MNLKDDHILNEKDIGRRVMLEKFPFREFGVITSFNPYYVFVKYDGNSQSEATEYKDLFYIND